MYDIKYLKTTIKIMQDFLRDLEEWSVYNQDRYNGQILDLKEKISDLKKEVEEDEYEENQRLLIKLGMI